MFKKHIQLIEKLTDFMQHADETLLKFHDAVKYCMENGVDEHLEVLANEISEREQNCDDIRREIEHYMFSESLLPETREDLYLVLELMDQVPNHCENVAFMIVDQDTSIIPDIKNDIMELIQVCQKAFKATTKAANDSLGKMEKVQQLIREIDDYHAMGSKIKRKIIKAIFSSKKLETHPGRQLVQKEIVIEIEGICGLCKHISEKILLAAIKRQV